MCITQLGHTYQPAELTHASLSAIPLKHCQHLGGRERLQVYGWMIVRRRTMMQSNPIRWVEGGNE
jgi:hypothetical protein